MASRIKNEETNGCAHLPGQEGVVERRTGRYKEKGSKPVGSDSKRWLLGIRTPGGFGRHRVLGLVPCVWCIVLRNDKVGKLTGGLQFPGQETTRTLHTDMYSCSDEGANLACITISFLLCLGKPLSYFFPPSMVWVYQVCSALRLSACLRLAWVHLTLENSHQDDCMWCGLRIPCASSRRKAG